MKTGIPKLGNFIAVAHVVEKYKVSGSIARMLLRELIKDGSLLRNDVHGKQFMCYPKPGLAAPKVAATDAKKDDKKEKGKKGK